MADIQYKRVVNWSTDIKNVGLDENGLAVSGQKITTGAPDTTANVYQIACIIQNVFSGVLYVNTGTSASPTWSTIDVT